MPSFFEMLTALAFLYFAESGVEIAVLEVGMGGRLDATNVVEPLISVVTDISLDHMEWLGPTIAAIAREKAGILRAGGTMITLPQHPEANQVLGEVATELDVRGVSAVPYMPASDAKGPYTVEALGATVKVDSPLRGAHQQRNVALAIAAAVELATRHGFAVSPAAIEEGIRQTQWPGRLERMTRGGVEWVLDVAHNPAGAWALRAGMRSIVEDRRPRILIFSCLRDKPLAEMAQILFPLFEQRDCDADSCGARGGGGGFAGGGQGNGDSGDGGGVRTRGAGDGAGERCGWRGSGVGIGVPCRRGAGDAFWRSVGGKERNKVSTRPNPTAAVLSLANECAAGAAACAVTAACGLTALAVSLVDKKGRAQHGIARLWARCGVWSSLSRLKVEGAENLSKHRVAVYAPNHTSYMDIPVVFAALPFQFRILAKKELWRWPFIGWYLRALGADADQHRKPTRDAREPGRCGEGAARRHAAGSVSGGRADLGWRAETLSVGRGVPGDSRAGAAGADCAEGRLRSAANSHAPFLSRRADGADWRADRDERHDVCGKMAS